MLSNRYLISCVAGAVVVLWTMPVSIAGQSTSVAEKKESTSSVPRTPWGDPDLQGIWSHFDGTPLQTRDPDPVSAAATAKARALRYGPTANPETGEREGEIFGGASREDGRPTSPRRNSLVVDPPSGRIPLLPGKYVYWDPLARGDHWTKHFTWERCMTRGVPAAYFRSGYSSGFQIFQSPGYVVMLPEMIHDARIIPLDGRPHVGKDIRLWNGDPRGHWEGDTLVIETTNFNNKGQVVAENSGAIYQTEGLRVVERWTRVDEKTIQHKITVEDPNTYSAPWTIELPHNLDPTYVIYEYACHEANQNYMEGSLRQGRMRDQEAARTGKRKQ